MKLRLCLCSSKIIIVMQRAVCQMICFVQFREIRDISAGVQKKRQKKDNMRTTTRLLSYILLIIILMLVFVALLRI